jgi:hypothetical protein
MIPAGLHVDCDFPGGNLIVERIEGDEVWAHQDLRDTEGPWFYWHFRVRGAAGRTLTVHFTQSPALGARGPAVSFDAGRTWAWLGTDSVKGSSFCCPVPEETVEARFCFATPYLEANLREFVAARRANPHLVVEALCTTPQGRPVEQLRAGRLDGEALHRVLVTCRHHCCEMMASYVLEGLIDGVLTDEWLRRHVELLAIPFVDKDGVEAGDQGKNRRPRDHNRDYEGESLYPSVRAIRESAPVWGAGRLRLALDLHCPYISGPREEVIYFVGSPDAEIWAEATRFAETLESLRTGPLPYRVSNNLPFGQGWNTDANLGAGKSFCRWAGELPGIRFATTLEVPYANAGGVAVTPETARAFGRDLAGAMRAYLQSG